MRGEPLSEEERVDTDGSLMKKRGGESVKYYDIDKTGFESPSVPQTAVACVLAPAGAKVYEQVGRRSFALDEATYIVGDYIKEEGAALKVRRIRQMMPAGRGIVQCWICPSPIARAWGKRHHMPRVTVRGGLKPIVPAGHVAVPDFAMSGTNWYIMPEGFVTYEMLEGSQEINEAAPREMDGCVPVYAT